MNLNYNAICLSSANRLPGSGPPSDCIVQLATPIELKRTTKLSILQFFTYVNNAAPVNSLYNTIPFQENSGPIVIATLPPGFYKAIPGSVGPTQIVTAIETAMNAVSPNGYTYTATIDPLTFILTVTASAGTFAFMWSSGSTVPIIKNSFLSYLMGYGAVQFAPDTAQANSQVAPDNINVTSPGYFLIKINLSTNMPLAINNTSDGQVGSYIVPTINSTFANSFFYNNSLYNNTINTGTNSGSGIIFQARVTITTFPDYPPYDLTDSLTDWKLIISIIDE